MQNRQEWNAKKDTAVSHSIGMEDRIDTAPFHSIGMECKIDTALFHSIGTECKIDRSGIRKKEKRQQFFT